MPGPRASDDDREVVVTRLREAAGRGQIDLEELEQRIVATYEARTVGDLVPITADLEPVRPTAPGGAGDQSQRIRDALADRMAGRGGTGRVSAMDDEGFRAHLTVYCAVIGFLVLIWLVTGAGHPWPIYPAGGWGIGLASHWQGAVSAQRRRQRGDDEDDEDGRRLDRADRHHERDQHRLQRKMHNLERRGLEIPVPKLPPDVAEVVDSLGLFRRSQGNASRDAGASTASNGPTDRRFVVAEFVDVVGSTSLNEALGDEGWMRVRERFRALVDECVRDTGGFEANTAGDGVLVRFDHPTGAVRCGVEILRRLERQRRTTGFAPSVRIGIHSGDAVSDGDDIIGAVVNLASRVTGAAEPDELLCTEHVADHLEDNYTTVGRGLHTLKGVTRPRHLLAVDWRN